MLVILVVLVHSAGPERVLLHLAAVLLLDRLVCLSTEIWSEELVVGGPSKQADACCMARGETTHLEGARF